MINQKYYILSLTIFLFLNLFSNIYSNSTVDSLQTALQSAKGQQKVDILLKISTQVRNSDPDKSYQSANEALTIARHLNYDAGLALAYYRLGYYNYSNADFIEALENFKQAAFYYEISGDLRRTGMCHEFIHNCCLKSSEYELAYTNIDLAISSYQKVNAEQDIARLLSNSSQLLTRLGNLDQALTNLHTALEIKERMFAEGIAKDRKSIASTLHNIGIILLKTKDFERALEYFFKAVKIREEYGDVSGLYLSNIGIAYQQLGQYEESLKFHNEALSIYRQENSLENISSALNNIGYLYDLQKQWEKSLDYYLQALELKREVSDIFGVANCAKNAGSIYLELGDLDSARRLIDESMMMAENNNMVEIIRDNNYLYSRLYEKQQNYQKALEYERIYSAQKDSTFTQSMQDRIAEMETKYNLREEKRANEILQRDNQILMLTAEKANLAKLRSYLFVIFFLLLVILLTELYFRKRTKEKLLSQLKNELEGQVLKRTQELERTNLNLMQEVEIRKKAEKIIHESLHEKEVMLREIHHRVKNNLQVISSIINLQIEKENLKNDVSNLLLNIQNRIYSMSLIHEKLYSEDNLAKIDFASYTKGLVEYLLSNYQEKNSNIVADIDIEDIKLNVTTGIPCGLLINEIVTNSIKYAFPNNEKGIISISMKKEKEDKIILKICNNGADFDFEKAEKQNTIGLKLIKLLSKQLRGKLQIKTEDGVCYTLKFKEIG